MIYLPTNFQPKNEARDMSIAQMFSVQVHGVICTDYQIIIKNNDTGVTIYDSTKLHLSIPLYDKSTLYHTVPANSITNGVNYKWIITVYENTNNVTSGEQFFKSYGNPTVTLSIPLTISTQAYSPRAIYYHPQSISIQKFKYILYDSSDNVLTETDYFYSANLTYDFDGFLNGSTYQIECIVMDQNDITVSSGKQSFNVNYSQPNVNVTPVVEILEDKSASKIKWGKAVQVSGVTTGIISYIDFLSSNNKAINLEPYIIQTNLTNDRNSTEINPMDLYNYTESTLTPINIFSKWGVNTSDAIITKLGEIEIDDDIINSINDISTLKYDVNIPSQFNFKCKIIFGDGFVSGVFLGFGTNDDYKIGYNGIRFYFNNKGSVYYGTPKLLPTEAIYIDVRPTDVFIDGIRLGF